MLYANLIILQLIVAIGGLLLLFASFIAAVGFVARKTNLNPFLCSGVATLVTLAFISQNIPNILATIIGWEFKVLAGKQPEKVFVPLKDGSNVKLKFLMSNVNFDIPLNYIYQTYSRKSQGWQNVTKDQFAGNVRNQVDFIDMTFSLPDLLPLTESNLPDFAELGYGRKKVTVRLLNSQKIIYNTAFLESRTGSTDADGTKHYYINNRYVDLYLSDKPNSPDLTAIECKDQKHWHLDKPVCDVTTTYHPPSNTKFPVNTTGFASYQNVSFILEYHMAASYLPKWRDIDRNLKSKIDQFANNSPPGHAQ